MPVDHRVVLVEKLTGWADHIDELRRTYTTTSFARRMAEVTDQMREDAAAILLTGQIEKYDA